MRELVKWFSITSRYCSNYLNHRLEKLDLNSSQYFYVLLICEKPGITQDALFQKIHVNPSNITRALIQLEKSGYITRMEGTKDKRTWHLFPTDKATGNSATITDIILECSDAVLDCFSEEERQLFLPLLQKAAKNAISMNQNTEDFSSELKPKNTEG